MLVLWICAYDFAIFSSVSSCVHFPCVLLLIALVNAVCVQLMLSTSLMHQDNTEKKALLCAIAPCQQTLTPSRSELKQVTCSLCVEKGRLLLHRVKRAAS